MGTKAIALIQARMGSSRFPGKVLSQLHDKPVLAWVVQAAANIKLVDEVVVATSTQAQDQAIVDWCQQNQIAVFTGHETDVLARFYDAATHHHANIVIRITADCPFLQPELASQLLYLVQHQYADYASNVQPATWPDGVDCEVFTYQALKTAYDEAIRASDREHVTPFIRNHQHRFKVLNITCPIPALGGMRWTIDTPEDLAYAQQLLAHTQGSSCFYQLLNATHALQSAAPTTVRNEGFQLSLQAETVETTTYTQSQALLERALKTIPCASQTFSKSHIQYPEKASPHFVTHGYHGHVWDVDGNEYVDLVSGLLPNILGYADADVNDAIQQQLQKGITLSLPLELEITLAEKLCEIIPCAEQVRFGKNGTDVTSAAIRLARAYTQRDKVIVCGYHGWQDWSIGTTTRNLGIPKAVCALSQTVPYNDLASVEQLLKTQEYAALIMEPCNVTAPLPGYLAGIKDLCQKYGSVLIFDEIITGFRFALGGAQSYFGVTPHLACFGKAMANGMPISAVVGQRAIMQKMDDIFFSGTFGGEALSLAAAIATIEKIESHDVINYLWQYGENLAQQLQTLIEQNDLTQVIQLKGFSPWKLLQFQDQPGVSSFEIKTYFMQEMLKRGILVVGSHNISYAHNAVDFAKIIQAYAQTLPLLAKHIGAMTLQQQLRGNAIQPLFKIR